MQLPPLLPDHSLRRVLAISRVDGWSIVAVAAASALLSLAQGAWLSAGAGMMAVLAGSIELRGRRALLQGRLAGLGRMIAAQLGLLAIIWVYAWFRWRHFDPAMLWAELPGFVRTAVDRNLMATSPDPELDRALLLEMLNTLTCLVLAFVSVFYQGGLAYFYHRQRGPIRQGLADRQAQPPPTQASAR